MNLLPIGTLVRYNDTPLLICGYSLNETDRIIPSYRVVIFPIGYINKDSIKLVPVDEDIIVVRDGYKNESFELFEKFQKNKFEVLNGLTNEDFEKIYGELTKEK